MKRQIVLSAIIALSSISAFADQCAVVTQKQAKAAKALIESHSVVSHFCGRCGDTEEQLIDVEKVIISKFGKGKQYTVSIEDQDGQLRSLDLAYTFIPNGKSNEGLNVAELVGCPFVK